MMCGVQIGESRMFRFHIPITERHLGRVYPQRKFPPVGVFYTLKDYYQTTNPVEAALQEEFEEMDIQVYLESALRSRCVIRGTYYTLDPPIHLMLKNFYSGRPLRRGLEVELDLYEGRLGA